MAAKPFLLYYIHDLLPVFDWSHWLCILLAGRKIANATTWACFEDWCWNIVCDLRVQKADVWGVSLVCL